VWPGLVFVFAARKWPRAPAFQRAPRGGPKPKKMGFCGGTGQKFFPRRAKGGSAGRAGAPKAMGFGFNVGDGRT